MAQVFRNFRDSPTVPPGWKARPQPGAVVKVPIKQVALLKFLQQQIPGRWMKVYHYGADGSEVHYCRHQSGPVFDVEYHAAK